MNNYFQIVLGAMLGMLLLISVKSVYIQQSSKYELGFLQAFKVYTTKYTGPIWVGCLVLLIVMFVLPNVIGAATVSTGSTIDDVQYVNWFKKFLKYMRFYSVGLGVIAQGLGFIIIRKGEKFLRDEENKIGDGKTDV